MRTSRVECEGQAKGFFRAEFDSIDEIAEYAFNTTDSFAVPGGSWYSRFDSEWQGARSPEEVKEMSRHGWQDELPEVMAIAGEAVETVNREYELTAFKPFWDVTGCEVDVGRYLSNEPENMIDYVITPTVRSGRVVTICSSICYSAGIPSDVIMARGRIVTALALAVSRLGYGVELYADATVRGNKSIRTLVKGANDELDPAKIMFAYAHPASLRTLILGWTDADGRTDVPDELSHFGTSGSPMDPPQDLPQGTVYLPSVVWDRKVPPASEELERHLKNLGII